MSFKITATRIVKDETLTASVTFTLTDATEVDVDVPIFLPQSKEDVLQGIANRELTEQRKHDGLVTNTAIKSDIDKDVVDVEFEVFDGVPKIVASEVL